MKLAFMKISMALVIVAMFSLCSNQVEPSLTGKYQSSIKGYSIQLEQQKDSLIGTHCFITDSGNRIDCCLEEEGSSLKLKRISKGVFTGSMKSCYDNQNYEITVYQNENGINLELKQNHEFLEKETKYLFTKKVD